jgi:hypothetical protein
MKLFYLALLLAAMCLTTFVYATVDQELFYHTWSQHLMEEPTTDATSMPQLTTPLTDKLDSSLTGFDVSQARIYSRLAAAAYCAPAALKKSQKGLEKWSCKACTDSGLKLDNVSPFHIALADLYGYIGYDSKSNTIILVFTGSQSIVNWLYNLDAAFIPFPDVPNAEIHKGFYNSWQYARPTVIAMLDALFYQYPSASLSISGHSLGGAVANIARIDLATAKQAFEIYDYQGDMMVFGGNSFDVPFNQLYSSISSSPMAKKLTTFTGKYKLAQNTYSFGAPRVGNTVLADWAMSLIGKDGLLRLVHAQDPVPHLPPILLWPTASHLTTEVFFTTKFADKGDFIQCPLAETPYCSNQYLIPTSMSDHLSYFGYTLGTPLDTAC